MKIGIVCFPSYGGSGALATELGKKLAKKGHKIHFITSEVPFRIIGSWQKNVYFHQTGEIDYPLFSFSLFPLTLIDKIVEVAQNEKLDIIHAHYALPHVISGYMAKKILEKKGHNIKLITTLHGTDVSVFSDDPSINETLKFAINGSDAITAVCKYLADIAKDKYELKKTPKVIYNFIEIKRDANTATRELKDIFAKPDEKIIIHMSNFREVKRVHDVITIFNAVNKKIPSKLLLIGDGPDQRLAQKLASKYGIINKIFFMGLQSNIGKLLPIADIFLLPSEKEGFNLSALEAMTCGVPVVVSRAGGMPEMIEDGKEGFLSDIGDIDTMVKKTIEILSSPKLAKTLSQNAQKKVKDNFTPEIIVDQYEKLYEQVLRS